MRPRPAASARRNTAHPITVYNDSMSTLTRRQQQILDVIRDFQQRENRPPTQAEITAIMGFASRTASKDHLRALARKGLLELTPGAARGIRLLEPAGLPLVGTVAAGQPILAREHIEAHHALPPALFRAKADYLLRVRGLSMRDAGILDGDLLAVQRTPDARSGQIVVARIEDEVTVKRFWQDGARVELRAENPDFAPIVIDLSRQPLAIEGRMVGLIRP